MQAAPPPALNICNGFTDPPEDCQLKYSNPAFFHTKWAEDELKKYEKSEEERKRKKEERKANRSDRAKRDRSSESRKAVVPELKKKNFLMMSKGRELGDVASDSGETSG